MLGKKLLGYFTQQHPQMALLTFTPLTNAFNKMLLNKMHQSLQLLVHFPPLSAEFKTADPSLELPTLALNKNWIPYKNRTEAARNLEVCISPGESPPLSRKILYVPFQHGQMTNRM